MPIPLRRRHALGMLPFLLLLPLAGRPAAAEALTLEQLMARMAAIPERRATFREERRFAALEGTLLSTGRLIYRRGRLEKLTDWPQFERLEVEGDRIVLMEGNDVPRVVEMDRAPELRVLVDAIRGPLLGDAEALRRAFRPALTGTLAGWTLDLVPRDAAAARLLQGVRLQGREDQIDRIVLTQANGDVQAMAITPQ